MPTDQLNQSFFLLTIILANTQEKLFTSGDTNYKFNGKIYNTSGLKISRLVKTVTIAPDELRCELFIDQLLVKSQEINNDYYRKAQIILQRFDGRSVNELFHGTIYKLEIADQILQITALSAKQKFFRTICKTFSPTCRAKLGDNKCKASISSHIISDSIAEIHPSYIIGNKKITDSKYYNNGYLLFHKNKQRISVIYVLGDRKIFLLTKTIFKLEINDNYELHAGCNKTVTDCKNIYNNLINFQGEPKMK